MTKTRTGLVHNAKGEGFEEVISKKIKPKVAPRAPNRAGTNSVSKSKDKDKKMDTPGKKKDEKEEVTITISTEDCLHCNQNVDEDEKALECDSCKKWAHLGCTEVRASQYSFLDANDVSGLKWICRKCIPTFEREKAPVGSEEMSETMKMVFKQQQATLDSINGVVNILQQQMGMILQILQNDKRSEERVKIQVDEYMNKQNESQEREKIKNNIVLFNIPEATSTVEHECKREDMTKIKEVLNFVDKEAKADEIETENVFRLGRNKRSDGKPRPIKVILDNYEKKRLIMTQSKNLKNFEKFAKVGISNDRTFNERNNARILKGDLVKKKKENPEGDFYIDYREGVIKEGTTKVKSVEDRDTEPRPHGTGSRGQDAQ